MYLYFPTVLNLFYPVWFHLSLLVSPVSSCPALCIRSLCSFVSLSGQTVSLCWSCVYSELCFSVYTPRLLFIRLLFLFLDSDTNFVLLLLNIKHIQKLFNPGLQRRSELSSSLSAGITPHTNTPSPSVNDGNRAAVLYFGGHIKNNVPWFHNSDPHSNTHGY